MIPHGVLTPPHDTKLPPHLIVEFWANVYERLQVVHGFTRTDAATAIIRHRADEHLAGDMAYHNNWYDVADTIAIGWRSGALRPPTVAPSTAAPLPSTPPAPSPTGKP